MIGFAFIDCADFGFTNGKIDLVWSTTTYPLPSFAPCSINFWQILMCAKVAVADLEKFNYSQILPPSFLSIFSVSFLRFFWKSTYMEKFFWQKKCKIKAHSVDSFGASLTLRKKFSTIPDGGCGDWKEILTFCTLNIVLQEIIQVFRYEKYLLIYIAL